MQASVTEQQFAAIHATLEHHGFQIRSLQGGVAVHQKLLEHMQARMPAECHNSTSSYAGSRIGPLLMVEGLSSGGMPFQRALPDTASDLTICPMSVAEERGWDLDADTGIYVTSVNGASGQLARVRGGLPVTVFVCCC